MTKGKSTIMLSGGFDPIHVGHVRMIAAAAEIGDVIVVANSDDWLMRKKGYIFMPWEERAEIIASITGVKEVGTVKDGDGTVCEALERVRPEMALCEQLGIEMVWGLGGGKIQSSSDLVKDANLAPEQSNDPDVPKPDKSIILRGKNSEN